MLEGRGSCWGSFFISSFALVNKNSVKRKKKKKGIREALRANLDFKTEGSLKRKIHFLFRREIFIFFSEWKFPVMHFTQNIQTHYFWYYLMFAHPVIFFYWMTTLLLYHTAHYVVLELAPAFSDLMFYKNLRMLCMIHAWKYLVQ